jgi:metal-responsive CopG/Arc/MetJ family transcriptional regulator
LQKYRDIAEIKKNIFGIIYLILPHKKIFNMQNTHTNTTETTELKKLRGRRRLPEGERKVAITIFVKQKHFNDVRREIKQLEGKYNTITDTTNVD